MSDEHEHEFCADVEAALRTEVASLTTERDQLRAVAAALKSALPKLPRYMLDRYLDTDIGRLNYDTGVTLRQLMAVHAALALLEAKAGGR